MSNGWEKIMKIFRKIFVSMAGLLAASGVAASLTDYMKNRKMGHEPYGIYEAYGKRFFDFVWGCLAVLIVWPAYAAIGVLVKVKLGSPVLFRQERPGRKEEIFQLYKFRTMTEERDEEGKLLPDQERLTKFGKALRSSSLDELPELFNIIKGDMSFVGPRPLAVQYLPYYSGRERRRHRVRPGLTGLAQVHGRNAASWEERFSYDLEYAGHVTFGGDVQILLQTVGVVLSRRDIGVRGIDSPMDFDEYRKRQCGMGPRPMCVETESETGVHKREAGKGGRR